MNSNGVSGTLSAIVLQVTLKWNRAPGFSTCPTALASCRSASKREAQPAEFLCSRTRHGGRTSFQPLSRSLLTYWRKPSRPLHKRKRPKAPHRPESRFGCGRKELNLRPQPWRGCTRSALSVSGTSRKQRRVLLSSAASSKSDIQRRCAKRRARQEPAGYQPASRLDGSGSGSFRRLRRRVRREQHGHVNHVLIGRDRYRSRRPLRQA
jgi:hypothetical protein